MVPKRKARRERIAGPIATVEPTGFTGIPECMPRIGRRSKDSTALRRNAAGGFERRAPVVTYQESGARKSVGQSPEDVVSRILGLD